MDCTKILRQIWLLEGVQRNNLQRRGNYQEICEPVAAVMSAAAAIGGTGHVVDKRTDS